MIEDDLREVNLMIGGSDQEGLRFSYFRLGTAFLAEVRRVAREVPSWGVCGRHSYSNGGAEVQGFDGFVEVVRHRLRSLSSCTELTAPQTPLPDTVPRPDPAEKRSLGQPERSSVSTRHP